MPLRSPLLALLLALGAIGACGTAGSPSAASPPPDPPLPEPIAVGAGELEAYAADLDGLALCLASEPPRLVLVRLPAGPVVELPRPLPAVERCDRIALDGDRVCVASYDGGAACTARDGGVFQRPTIDGPPTGLALEDGTLWVATDGAGLWRVPPDDAPVHVLDLTSLMSGLVAGPFGIAWGTGGEFVWRTRYLPRGNDAPKWLRPPLPPNVHCADEAEVCEWVSTAAGWFGGAVWFAAANAPAPLYAWQPEDDSWMEFQVVGEVHVGPAGVFAVRSDGTIEMLDLRGEAFIELEPMLRPGESPVAASGGLWALGDGALRLVVPVTGPPEAHRPRLRRPPRPEREVTRPSSADGDGPAR